MLQYIISVVASLLLVIISATVLVSAEEKDVELQSFSTKSPESISAVYKTNRDFSFNISSSIQDGRSIVSVISLDEVDWLGKMKQPLILSQLIIPKEYLNERKIPDMEQRIIGAAKDLVNTSHILGAWTGLDLFDIAKFYDVMIRDLVQISGVQHKFNQGQAAFIYHDSIARSALRLSMGVSPKDACPAHQAYDFQGLFACQQEYSQHAKNILSSKLLECKDLECIKNIKKYLAYLMGKYEGDLDLKEVEEIAKDVLGLRDNSKLAEDIARFLACGNITCIQPGCNHFMYVEGWYIDGADWGCCGDYPGCCFLATEVCLVHDAICTCCSFPAFCLDPFCKPDAWCSNMTTSTAPPIL